MTKSARDQCNKGRAPLFGPVGIAAVELLELGEVVGAERLADAVFLAEPFAEVDHLAARGAERAGRLGEILRRFAAGGAGNLAG